MPIVQAFARHRIAHSQAARGDREAIAKAIYNNIASFGHRLEWESENRRNFRVRESYAAADAIIALLPAQGWRPIAVVQRDRDADLREARVRLHILEMHHADQSVRWNAEQLADCDDATLTTILLAIRQPSGELDAAEPEDCCKGFERSDGAMMHSDDCPLYGIGRLHRPSGEQKGE